MEEGPLISLGGRLCTALSGPNPAMEEGNSRGRRDRTRTVEKGVTPTEGLGAIEPKAKRAPRERWGPIGLCPWGGEGMALPVQETTPFPREPER